MADFISQLNGTQMDTALMGVARHDPEAWAVGQRNGQNVSSTDETYENNAKYYADRAKTDLTDSVEAAEDAAARAEGAVPAGTAGAVFFDRAQSLTDSQKEQARANIAAANSNRNLLDNPFFTVNQKSTSGTYSTASTTFMDRWVLSTGSVSVSASGVTLSSGGAIRQYIEKDRLIDGGTFTLSVKTQDGNIYSASGTIDFGGAGGNWQISATLIPNQLWVGVRLVTGARWDVALTSTNGVAISAVKLELGSYSTLTSDTPPDYGEELRKCRRYFRRYAPNQTGLALIGRAGSATEADFILGDEPMAKSTGITAAINGAVYARAGDNTNHSVTSATVQTSIGGGPALICTTSGLTAYATAVIVFASGGYIDINGDL